MKIIKSIISEILETILFILVLYITLWISVALGLNIYFPYILVGLMIIWVAVKMVFRRVRHNKKSGIDKDI
jgi:hypothetical protein